MLTPVWLVDIYFGKSYSLQLSIEILRESVVNINLVNFVQS